MGADLPVLGAARVSVAYGHTRALSEASFSLGAGAVTALVGPNGSGKSTLLRAISRLVAASSGRVSLGADVADASTLSAREFARRVTLLSQQRPTPVGITVADVVGFGRHPHRTRWRGRDEGGPAAVAKALELTGLTELSDHRLDTLSGGQLQRAWFASALAQQTGVLLLDEPTNHLDLRYQVDVLRLIRSLAVEHGVGVGVVLHDLNHAVDVADRIVVLDRGRVVADDSPERALDSALLSRVWGLPITVAHDAAGYLDVRAHRVRTGPPPPRDVLAPEPATT